MATLLPIRSASQRKHVSDLLAMSAMTLRLGARHTAGVPWTGELAAWPSAAEHDRAASARDLEVDVLGAHSTRSTFTSKIIWAR